MSWAYTHVEQIRFGDLDSNRHLNNVVFLRYFESARIAYLGELLPDHDPVHPKGGVGLIFARCEIEYRSPGRFGERVEIDVRAADVRRVSFKVEFQMRVGERLLAQGDGTLVAYDYAAERATALSADIRDRLLLSPA